MNTSNFQINLQLAWLWILLGFASGMLLGLFFHRDQWLGGYSSLRRRMYRLGHISFFGLGAVNLFFWLTFRGQAVDAPLTWASRLLVVGAVAMPICCALMAHFSKARLLFAVPVTSLLAGGTLAVLSLLPPNDWHEFTSVAKTLAVAHDITNRYYAPPTRPGPWPSNNQ